MAIEWYVLHGKPHKEELLAEQLELRRIETIHPGIRVQVVNPRAHKVRPYFRGYVFMHVDLDKMGLSALHTMQGSAGLIMFVGIPAWKDSQR